MKTTTLLNFAFQHDDFAMIVKATHFKGLALDVYMLTYTDGTHPPITDRFKDDYAILHVAKEYHKKYQNLLIQRLQNPASFEPKKPQTRLEILKDHGYVITPRVDGTDGFHAYYEDDQDVYSVKGIDPVALEIDMYNFLLEEVDERELTLPTFPERYQIIVSNLGTVLKTDSYEHVSKEYNIWVAETQAKFGSRAYGESVTLFENYNDQSNILKEHEGTSND